ncbi:MAG: 16S rRNA (uracil(1498)-N(3))-methyltransferase [Pseudomonadota bacterium]
MPQPLPKIRLHVPRQDAARPWAAGDALALGRDQAHYLVSVMRLTAGGTVCVFNGQDGEWLARLAEAGKRAATLALAERLAPAVLPPDVWLIFAPLKKARTDYVVEKAAELGCRRIVPCLTRLTNAERVNVARLQAHAIEAAEQCGLTHVPEVATPVRLEALLAAWPTGRRLMVCDERAAGFNAPRPVARAPAAAALAAQPRGAPWAVLCGPEGGFDDAEIARLAAMEAALAVGLGPRVLRADTAAVAALALWQATLGDWGGEDAERRRADAHPRGPEAHRGGGG